MYVIIWEYQVRAGNSNEFEEIYKSIGVWAKLFQKASGYISTELLRAEARPDKYITIDRWASAESYQAFHVQFKKEYELLDAQCERLTEHEILLGMWESTSNETR